MPQPPKDLKNFSSLLQIVSDLRSPEGCPWDKEQTHKSLVRYTIEECFELVDALESEDDLEIKDELGDVLFQVILHSQLATESKKYTIEDVIENLNKKMVRRHPHVFSTTKVSDVDEVWKNWDSIKAEEKKSKPKNENSFGIPKSLEALTKSVKIGEKSKKYNFDWRTAEDVLAKVEEELSELREAMNSKNSTHIEEELGDLLFSISQLARHNNLNPHTCLKKANDKFEKRFFKMKSLIESDKQNIKNLSDEELETYWKKIKN